MPIFRPAWNRKNELKALKAYKKKESALYYKKIMEIAGKARHWSVRRAAVDWFKKSLDNRPAGASVFGDAHYKSYEVNLNQAIGLALAKVTDQTALADIALNDPLPAICIAASKKLTDQSILADIARNNPNLRLREEAAKKLQDQDMIAQIAAACQVGAGCRLELAHKLKDECAAQKIFEAVADNPAYSSEVRFDAIKAMTDRGYAEALEENLYNSIARDTKATPWKRIGAISSIHDKELAQTLYAEILLQKVPEGYYRSLTSSYAESLKEAAKRLTKQRLLEKVLNEMGYHEKYGVEKEVFEIIKGKITGQDAIVRLILSCHESSDTSVEWKRLLEITDKNLLHQIACNDECPDLYRWKACKMTGGHFFDQSAINKCKCSVCGFQYHIGCANKGKPWKCERCGGIAETAPFVEGLPHTTITYQDGTQESFIGYDGLLATVYQMAIKHNLI